jgi:PatG Domain
MEQVETNENPAAEVARPKEALPTNTLMKPVESIWLAQTSATPCPTCGAAKGPIAATTSYVYALGQIETRFPRPSVEKEMAQAIGRAETAGRTDEQAFYQVLSQRENRYLARPNVLGSDYPGA